MSAPNLDIPRSAEQEELIQHAAELTGQSVTEFAVAALTKSVKKSLRNRLRMLSQQDGDRFTGIVNKSEPNEALRRAAEDYKRQYEQRVEHRKAD